VHRTSFVRPGTEVTKEGHPQDHPSGRPDAVEFVDVYKAFGRTHILRGLTMGLPEAMVPMVLGPSARATSAIEGPSSARSK
jgi:hypothetical protein